MGPAEDSVQPPVTKFRDGTMVTVINFPVCVPDRYRWGVRVMAKGLVVIAVLAVGIAAVFSGAGMAQSERTRFYVYFPMYLKSGIFVFPVEYSVPKTVTPAREALTALAKGPVGGSFLHAMIPRDTTIRSVTIRDGIITVDFGPEIRKMSVGSGGEAAVVSAIVNTACQFPGVRAARILVEGAPAESLAGHVDITGPLEPNRTALFWDWNRRFPDVPYWAEGYICLLQAMDFISGCGDGTFAPDRQLTRSELIQLLVEATGLPYVTPDAGENMPFRDVPATAWYYDAVRRALRAGLVTPEDYGESLGPAELVTREEMVWLLVKAQDIYATSHPGVIPDEKAPAVRFSDEGTIAPRYADSVRKAQERGLVVGMPDGSFQPRKVLTRAEAAVAVARMTGIRGNEVLLAYPTGEVEWDGGDLTVLGAAAAFEGNVLIRAKDSAGRTIFVDHTTSTNGMGWGAFGFTIAADRLAGKDPALIEVYLISPRDGSEYANTTFRLVSAER